MSTPHAIQSNAGRRFVGLMAAWKHVPKAKAWPVKAPGNGWNFHKGKP